MTTVCVNYIQYFFTYLGDIIYNTRTKKLINIYGDNIVDIQHVGSTAIKGIVAKPMLDIAVVLKTITETVFNTMKENGYEYYGEVVSGKHLFILRGEGEVSLQHIHCYEEKNCALFWDQIKFRDFIRSHYEFAKEYELLKQELYKMYSDDRKKYTEGGIPDISVDDRIQVIYKDAEKSDDGIKLNVVFAIYKELEIE